MERHKTCRASMLLLCCLLLVTFIYYHTETNTAAKTHDPRTDGSIRRDSISNGPPSEDRNRHRIDHLQKVCNSLPNNTFDKCHENSCKGNLFNVSHDIVYCSIEKSGSTFWRRILQVINKEGKVKNPWKDVKLNSAYTLKSLKDVDLKSIKEMMMKPEMRNVIFVRSPYTRLYSGWLDKFYSTNPYWWGLGRKIIARERIGATNHSLQCGHDVKFNEFVRFFVRDILEKPCGVDGHFSPSYRHCLPCDLPYNFIGKYETLREDIILFLEKANLTHIVEIFDFETSSNKDALKESSKWAFGQRKNVEKCMPFVEGLQKVWKRFQKRGMLNMEAAFPWKELSFSNITETQFRDTLLNAYHSFNIEDNNMNREMALKDAYSDVSQETMLELQDAFELDFKLFEYDRYPPFK